MKNKLDIVLVFPPQWSPFQPPLSLPSLYSWITNKGFLSRCYDLNIEFYWWLLSEKCAALLLDHIEVTTFPEKIKSVYRLIFSQSEAIRADIERLLNIKFNRNNELIQSHFVASSALGLYLKTISDVEESFDISAYHFKITNDYLNVKNIENFIDQPPAVISSFVELEVDRILNNCDSLSYGISCVGEEQLVFSLLIGKRIKELSNLPVVIGGTILSRIFRRGTLPKLWFEKYFDIIVVNEGEKPLDLILTYFNDREKKLSEIEGIVFYDSLLDQVVSTKPSAALDPVEIPIPNFDSMPLTRYISSEITLPLLASRGCYWGKCAFCHHGMVYGEKHSTYKTGDILETLKFYSEQYKASCFAFNDEAIPPKTFREIGQTFPESLNSGWTFTGLIKFEKYYNEIDFIKANRVGFKSLYVGFESASEKVLRLMKKNNTNKTMIKNLSDATKAGILMHCFVFFGFPGENEEDAEETFNFLLEHQDIIGSVGCGTFSLEHDAPIFHDLESFGVSLLTDNDNLDVYYKYNVKQGISQERAKSWLNKLNEEIFNIPKYASTNWIPREHLLMLLKHFSLEEIVKWGEELIRWNNILPNIKIGDLMLTDQDDEVIILVNRLSRKSLYITGSMAEALNLMIDKNISVSELRNFSEELFCHISSSKSVLTESIKSP